MYTFSTRALSLLMMGGLAGPIWAEAFKPSQELSNNRSEAVVAGDLNGNGHPDLVFGHVSNADTLWLNDGTGGFNSGGVQLSEHYTTSLHLADLGSDGDLDIFAGEFEGALELWENDPEGQFTKVTPLPTTANSSNEGNEGDDWNLGDFNNDGNLDIAVLENDSSNDKSVLSIWYGDGSTSGFDGIEKGSGEFTYFVPDETRDIQGYACFTLGTSNLIEDAAEEIVVGCAPHLDIEVGGIQVFQHDGNGLASVTSVLETDWGVDDLGFPDLDGDGDPDIVANHYNSHNTSSVTGKEHSAWVNDGASFNAANFDLKGVGQNGIDVADFNGDGQDDVMVADGSSVDLYCGTDGVDLAKASGAVDEGGAYAEAVAHGDFDGDGQLDLALASASSASEYDDGIDRVLLKNDANPCEGAESIIDTGGGNDSGGSSDNDDGDSGDSESSAGGGALGPMGLLALLGLWIGRFAGRTERA